MPQATMITQHLARLEDLLGKSGMLTGDDAASFETPLAGQRVPSLAVLRPRSTDEVAAAVKYCAEHGIAIIPQGGNTNVCRMTVPLPGQSAVILSLSRMNRILNVDPECSTLTAEAGATLQQAQEAAAQAGRLFAPDWGARGTAQIGGAVATNGGGLNVLRYGTTREQVLGMEVVLADGRVWDGTRALIKDNSGYDLKQLFIGSEGTLGIITKMVFKLHPAPVHTCSMMAVLTDSARLMDCLNLAKKVAGQYLAAFELMNGLGIELALKRYPDLKRPLEERADWYILIRLAGGEPVDATVQTLYERGFEDAIFSDAVLAQSEAQERNLWEIREQLIPTQYFSGPYFKWDVSVPINRMVDFLSRADTIARKHSPDAVPYAVGHVGDGNVHYLIFLPGVAPERAETLGRTYVEEIDSLIWSMGGSIVAEHGVGSIFRERVRRQKSPLEYEMMQQLKGLFDPKGIFNPGKLLEGAD